MMAKKGLTREERKKIGKLKKEKKNKTMGVSQGVGMGRAEGKDFEHRVNKGDQRKNPMPKPKGSERRKVVNDRRAE